MVKKNTKVTITLTSCKRPDLFRQTILSFYSYAGLFDCIDSIVWADDHSSKEDLALMNDVIDGCFANCVPIKRLFRDDGRRGLHYSLNDIIDNVEGDDKYVIHIEDDWKFVWNFFFIQDAIKILENNNQNVHQVLLKNRDMFDKYYTTNKIDAIPYYLWEVGQHTDYYGFTLNPSVFKIREYFNHYGYFNSNDVEKSWIKCYQDGWRTATLTYNCVEHIGDGRSSFVLNETGR